MEEQKKPVKKTVKNKVLYALTKYPVLRDDKAKLLYFIWDMELKKNEIAEQNLLNIVDAVMEGKLSNPETIGRWSRKLQETNIYLRGKEYNSRHGMQQAAIEHFNS